MSEKREPLNRMRKMIGDNLRKSYQEMPHASGVMRVDCTEMRRLQEQLKAEGVKASDSVIFVAACAKAMETYPQFNTRLEGDEIVSYDVVNPGIGMDTPKGLMVVTLRNVQGKNLREIAEAFKQLIEKVKTNKLTMDEVAGSTFTVSCLSKSRLDSFTSILNNNECVIMGMGGARKEPVVLEDDTIAVHEVCNIIINLNHILADGKAASDFCGKIAWLLENPTEML